MKAVMAFAGRAGSAARDAKGQLTGPWAGKTLGGASRGLSALGSIMEYAGARQQAASLDQSARDEEIAGRQEFIQASEQVSEIDRRFNQLIGEQMTTAAAYGVDVGSASVIEARRTAQGDADRQRTLIRNQADANAKMRRVRSLALREGAKNARLGSVLKLGLDLGQAAFG